MGEINLNKINLNGSSGGGGVPEAPTDDKTYGRKNASWVEIEGQPEPTGNAPLKFTAVEGDASLSFYDDYFDLHAREKLYKSSNGKDWEEWDYGLNSISIEDGKSIYIKGDNPEGFNTYSLVGNFGTSDKVKVEGNIMSLLGDTITEIPNEYCFRYVFSGIPELTSALELPASVLTPHCYENLFNFSDSISEVTIRATDISAEGCLTDWLKDAAESGVIYCDPSMVEAFQNDHNTPSGWTVKPILTLESLDGRVTSLELNVGDLSDLETTEQDSLVGAINEVFGLVDGVEEIVNSIRGI